MCPKTVSQNPKVMVSSRRPGPSQHDIFWEVLRDQGRAISNVPQGKLVPPPTPD